MAERTLRGARLGGQSFEDERGIEFAARQQCGYRCVNGHEFEVTMSVEAEVPAVWECPRCGAEALSNSPEVPGTGQNPRGLALAARGILTQRDARVLESLPGITVPVLVVVGANDTPFRAAADYMASKIPGATLAVLANAGHAANMDQPAAFNTAVLDFLGTLPSARPG